MTTLARVQKPARERVYETGRVCRGALCCEHPRGGRTSEFIGVVEAGWVFCCESGMHLFVAPPAEEG